MRGDVASILVGMGYSSADDFLVSDEGDGTVKLFWNAKTPQPTEAEIDAAVASIERDKADTEAKRIESDTARSEAKQALSELQPLVEHKDPAIALLAGVMQKHILATLGR